MVLFLTLGLDKSGDHSRSVSSSLIINGDDGDCVETEPEIGCLCKGFIGDALGERVRKQGREQDCSAGAGLNLHPQGALEH